MNKKQSYSASMLIEYTGTKAAKSLNPDDTVIDVSEIYSATVIDNVINEIEVNNMNAKEAEKITDNAQV